MWKNQRDKAVTDGARREWAKGELTDYRNLFRQARESALRDAEGFHDVFFAMERLGARLLNRVGTLNDYQPALVRFLQSARVAGHGEGRDSDWHTPVKLLVDQLRVARNDAMHQGAYARHLTSHAVNAAIAFEDALMAQTHKDKKVRDYMVREVLVAQPWQPLSYVRQMMLANSFSFLPYHTQREGRVATWELIEDEHLVRFISKTTQNRTELLGISIADAVAGRTKRGECLNLTRARVVQPNEALADAIEKWNGSPAVVVRYEPSDEPEVGATTTHLIGILTAFDVL